MTSTHIPHALSGLLHHQILLVTGKGGVGKSSVAAALGLVAARSGKRVLLIDIAAEGMTGVMLGERRRQSFQPRQILPNLFVSTLQLEETLQEYLNIFLKVPKMVRLSPMGRILDFLATSVPGPKDILVMGKVTYEAGLIRKNGTRVWDLIIVDGMATGHFLSQLKAPYEMQQLVRGGMINSQVAEMTDMLSDHKRTAAVICTTPEEMPLSEAVLCHTELRKLGIGIGVIVVNRRLAYHQHLDPSVLDLTIRRLPATISGSQRDELSPIIAEGLALYESIRILQDHEIDVIHDKLYHHHVIELPLLATRAGKSTTRALAQALSVHANGAEV